MNAAESMRIIYEWWANRFDIADGLIEKPGTVIITEPELDESGRVILYEIDFFTVIRTGPSAAAKLGLSAGYIDSPVLPEVFEQNCSAIWKTPESGPILFDHYLFEEDAVFSRVPGDCKSRIINPDVHADLTALKSLYEASTAEEIDEADIYIDQHDPVIFGLFRGEQLAAYASYRLWGEHIADIGVLIHPEYRNRGLGRAVTSEICRYCFSCGIVPMARIYDYHEFSLKIPRALGFKPLVLVHSYVL